MYSTRFVSQFRPVYPAAPKKRFPALRGARKAAAIMMVVGLLANGFSNTQAYFNDIEQAAGNAFTYGSLLIGLEGGPITSLSEATFERSLKVTNTGSLPFRFGFMSENAGPGCAELSAQLLHDGAEIASGSLTDLVFTSSSLPPAAADDAFRLLLHVPEGSDPNTCDFDMRVRAWQEETDWEERGFFNEAVLATHLAHQGNTGGPAGAAVVINEIMWMGSMADDQKNPEDSDEWIELRNLTDQPIDVGQWRIDNAKSNNHSIMIPANTMLPASGYLVIGRYPRASMNSNVDVVVGVVDAGMRLVDTYEDNGVLVLRDADDNVMDQTPPVSPVWPAGTYLNDGEASKRWSMERNLEPGDGSLAESWHTCNPEIMTLTQLTTMRSYWKTNAQTFNCGTPGAANLSKNDPTAPDYEPSVQMGGSSAPAAMTANNEDVTEPKTNNDASQPASEELGEENEPSSEQSANDGGEADDTQKAEKPATEEQADSKDSEEGSNDTSANESESKKPGDEAPEETEAATDPSEEEGSDEKGAAEKGETNGTTQENVPNEEEQPSAPVEEPVEETGADEPEENEPAEAEDPATKPETQPDAESELNTNDTKTL